MPHALASSDEISNVQEYKSVLQATISRSRDIRAAEGIERALSRSDFPDAFKLFDGLSLTPAVEAAARDVFYSILATTAFESANFVDVWNLLDICQVLSDNGTCESGLVFWLVEELLESLLVEQCRSVFDYLELRRDVMTAKHIETKKLIILRSCNELLKRLSRAEDTAFSGRVFIYLFQSLDFGDRSSVNLRGAFHVENVTVYDESNGLDEGEPSSMDIDEPEKQVSEPPSEQVLPEAATSGQTTLTTSKTQSNEQAASLSKLYPVFWSIQKYFCQPTALFNAANLNSLKLALEAAIAKFKETQKENGAGAQSTSDEHNPALKRKWDNDSDISDNFNPKYLTSPDLFELEISDLAFRRHILVQGLILMDFLLYQTPRSKKKIESLRGRNKAVIYNFTLSDEDELWVSNMRSEIASYLQQGAEGKFYYRMVDTVLSRDKNWVYWKAENCPSFSKSPVAPEEYVEARAGASSASASKRIRPTPMGGLDLGFLNEKAAEDGFAKLQDSEKFGLPSLDAYRGAIMDVELDIDMAKTDEEKATAVESKTSKTWRTLRLASRSHFKAFDKVDDGNNLDALFQSEEEKVKEDERLGEEEKAADEELSKDEEIPQAEESRTEGTRAEDEADVAMSTEEQPAEQGSIAVQDVAEG